MMILILILRRKKSLIALGCEEFLEEEDEAEAPTDLAFSRYRLYRSSMARISSSFLAKTVTKLSNSLCVRRQLCL